MPYIQATFSSPACPVLHRIALPVVSEWCQMRPGLRRARSAPTDAIWTSGGIRSGDLSGFVVISDGDAQPLTVPSKKTAAHRRHECQPGETRHLGTRKALIQPDLERKPNASQGIRKNHRFL